MNNPLLNVKIKGFGAWLVTHLFGMNWRVTLWAKVTSAVDTWLAANGNATTAEVQTFINDHITEFVATLSGGNPFISLALETLLGNVTSSLASELITYVESKIGSNYSTPSTTVPGVTTAGATPPK